MLKVGDKVKLRLGSMAIDSCLFGEIENIWYNIKIFENIYIVKWLDIDSLVSFEGQHFDDELVIKKGSYHVK